jgi:hypothetical protein
MPQGLDYLRVDNSDVFTRIDQRWEFIDGFPLPKWNVQCPCCREEDVQIHSFGFNRRGESPHPFRCNVGFKCRVCSMVWTLGVVVKSQTERVGQYDWRKARKILLPDEVT